jgi:hypothetical protein
MGLVASGELSSTNNYYTINDEEYSSNQSRGAHVVIKWSEDLTGGGATGPASVKTKDGVAKASVKTVDGTAIASVKTITGIA